MLIHSGAYQMGSPESEAWRVEDETQRTVTLSDYYISPCEVAQTEYLEIVHANPSNFSCDELPVEYRQTTVSVGSFSPNRCGPYAPLCERL